MAENSRAEVSFFRILFTASLLAVILSAYPAIKYAASVQLYSFLAGFLISLVNAVLGFRLNEMAFKKSARNFVVIIFGGMGIRIIILGIFIVILSQFPVFEVTSLVASVFFFYVLYMSIEIYYLHNKKRTL
jgi:hypothetical protein